MAFNKAAKSEVKNVLGFVNQCETSETTWRSMRGELQERMSKAGAHARSVNGFKKAVKEANAQFQSLEEYGCKAESPMQAVQVLRNPQLCFAHWMYQEATLFQVKSGAGSRGSSMVQDVTGKRAHKQLDKARWSFAVEDNSFQKKCSKQSLKW